MPVLDGNVYRFISRYIGIETPINTPKAIKEFKEVLNKFIDNNHPDIFNQAIMEFGALQCTPTNPDCGNCPFEEKCFAYTTKTITDFPVKLKAKKSIKRYFNYALYLFEDKFIIKQRKSEGIWEGLYEFPLIESKEQFENESLISDLEIDKSISSVSKSYKHILSHQNIYAKLYVFNCESFPKLNSQFKIVTWGELEELPIHRLMEKMIVDIQ